MTWPKYPDRTLLYLSQWHGRVYWRVGLKGDIIFRHDSYLPSITEDEQESILNPPEGVRYLSTMRLMGRGSRAHIACDDVPSLSDWIYRKDSGQQPNVDWMSGINIRRWLLEFGIRPGTRRFDDDLPEKWMDELWAISSQVPLMPDAVKSFRREFSGPETKGVRYRIKERNRWEKMMLDRHQRMSKQIAKNAERKLKYLRVRVDRKRDDCFGMVPTVLKMMAGVSALKETNA